MRGMVPPDPETKVSQVRFAVVHVPRRSRNRFAVSCVDIVETRDAAMASAQPDERHFAARVAGPSKSSEGQMLYYLVDWLDSDNTP